MDQFLGEIRLFAWGFTPKGWHLCDGTILPINQNAALFALLGTQYGGNGTTTFALPDMRGRTPIGFGTTHAIGAPDGFENVALTVSQLPMHTHTLMASNATGSAILPGGNAYAAVSNNTAHYAPDTTLTPLNPTSILPAGSSQPHNNMQPYLVMSYCISLTGIFPSRS